MTSTASAIIRIHVDPANPGQFFACCGLLELSRRLSPDAEGWFEESDFCISCSKTLREIIEAISAAELVQVDPSDATASAILIQAPFSLLLDWWKANDTVFSGLKVWAGTMESFRIARAMQWTMRGEQFLNSGLFDAGLVVY